MPRVSRRVVLGVVGGLMVSATAGAVLAAESGSSGTKLTSALTNGAQTRRRATPGRSATSTSPAAAEPGSRRTARGSSRAEQSAASAGHKTAGADPVYYIHDGPKTIALTIDDGPSPVYTPQILRLLEKHHVTASFSMIGRSVAMYPAIAREVAHAGHMIVNHTWDHADIAPMTRARVNDEIARTTEAIHRATGATPHMFRAPYGAWSPTVLRYCAENNLTALDWSVDPRDWAIPGTWSIIDNILRNTRTGSIILEHDGGGNRSETVAALTYVIPRLLDEGYRFRLP